MSHHPTPERMNEALDGALRADEVAALEAHLAACPPCREEHARLSETVTAVRSLPREARIPSGSWEAIARRIASAQRESPASRSVLPLPTSGPAPRGSRPGRRVSASVPQLAAAAVVIALLSAAVTWLALGPWGAETATARRSPDGSAEGAAARAVSLEDGGYAETVTRLEEILEEGRGLLAPETVVTIEVSLRTVDAAIAEVEAALAEDPNSDLLRRLLANHRSTKLGVLQRAATAVGART